MGNILCLQSSRLDYLCIKEICSILFDKKNLNIFNENIYEEIEEKNRSFPCQIICYIFLLYINEATAAVVISRLWISNNGE